MRHADVLRVQTHSPVFFPFREQVLHEIDDGRVTVLTLFGEQLCHSVIPRRHQVVDDHQVPRFCIGRRQVG